MEQYREMRAINSDVHIRKGNILLYALIDETYITCYDCFLYIYFKTP